MRLLLVNKASVIVQNSKGMFPNGFTTNMNIIRLLNKKASEYENRGLVAGQRRSRRGFVSVKPSKKQKFDFFRVINNV